MLIYMILKSCDFFHLYEYYCVLREGKRWRSSEGLGCWPQIRLGSALLLSPIAENTEVPSQRVQLSHRQLTNQGSGKNPGIISSYYVGGERCVLCLYHVIWSLSQEHRTSLSLAGHWRCPHFLCFYLLQVTSRAYKQSVSWIL